MWCINEVFTLLPFYNCSYYRELIFLGSSLLLDLLLFFIVCPFLIDFFVSVSDRLGGISEIKIIKNERLRMFGKN